MQETSRLTSLNRRQGQSGGDSERFLHQGAGLRNELAHYTLQGNHAELMTLNLTLAQHTTATSGFQDVTGSFWGGSILNQGFLAVPSTLCLTWTPLEPTATGGARTVAWRVTGWDQFGNHIQEEMPPMVMDNTTEVISTAEGFISYQRQWTSKVFAQVEKIEVSKNAYTTTNQATLRDNLAVGTVYQWDDATGWAVLWHDGTGGDFTLDVTIGGVTETTGVIAFGASAGTVATALEALANVVDVTVTVPTPIIAMSPTPTAIYAIQFLNPNLGKEALSVGTNSLTGGTQTITIAGPTHFGRVNCGIGSPFQIPSGGPVGRANNYYPDIIAGKALVGTSFVRLGPAPGSRTVPTGPGWRAGISEAGYAGDNNKLQLYLDGNSFAGLAGYDNAVFRPNLVQGLVIGPLHELDLWVRTTLGTGRRPTDSSVYPR